MGDNDRVIGIFDQVEHAVPVRSPDGRAVQQGIKGRHLRAPPHRRFDKVRRRLQALIAGAIPIVPSV